MVRVLASVVFVLLVVAYAAPSLIAILRAHRRWPMVVAIDILLGWTIVGWLIALAMALGLRMPRRQRRVRARRAPIAAPPAKNDPPVRQAAPAREHVEPPVVRDDSYAGWLEGGAAMNA